MSGNSSTKTAGARGIPVTIPAAVMLALLLTLHAVGTYGIRLYGGVFLLASVVYLWLARAVLRTEIPTRTVAILALLSILLRASFLFAVPAGSDDIYRYLWDGKVQTAGIDPYRFAPNAQELSTLKSDQLPRLVNHPEMRSVYFPVSQWIFFVSYMLSGEALWGFKLLLLLAEVMTILALWHLTQRMSLPRSNILLYALCPLPIIQFAYDGHLDGLGLPLLACAVLLYVSRRKIPSMLLLGISMGIKPVALVLVPIFALQEKKLSRILLTAALPCVPFVMQFIPYVHSPGMFEGLLKFSRHWTFNGVAFELVNGIIADNFPSRLVCTGALILSLLVLCIIRLKFISRMYLAVFALLLFSPVVHPWYICWLAVFLPVTIRWSGIVYAATASLTVLTVVGYQLGGVWEQHPLVLVAEYLPVLGVLVVEWVRRRRTGLREGC